MPYDLGESLVSRTILGSLSTRVFETRTATGREHFACQDSGVSQIFKLIISNGEKILSNVNLIVLKQVKRENSSLPVAVRVSKTRVLKLPTNRSTRISVVCFFLDRDEVAIIHTLRCHFKKNLVYWYGVFNFA